MSGSEAGEAFSRDPEELLGYSMTGCQRGMLANRLSYFFDFNGTYTPEECDFGLLSEAELYDCLFVFNEIFIIGLPQQLAAPSH